MRNGAPRRTPDEGVAKAIARARRTLAESAALVEWSAKQRTLRALLYDTAALLEQTTQLLRESGALDEDVRAAQAETERLLQELGSLLRETHEGPRVRG